MSSLSYRRSGARRRRYDVAAQSPLAWYDPSDLSTLWQDTGATSPVTTDGQSVARIDDKSGNGYHLSQGTSGFRPLYKTAGGLHWLLFDGVDDYLEGSTSISGVNAYALAAVMPVATATGFERLMGISVSGSPDFGLPATAVLFLRNSTNAEWGGYHNGSLRARLAAVNGTAYVMESVWTSGDHTFTVNGASNSAASSQNLSVNLLRIGCSFENDGSAAAFTNSRLYGAFIKVTAPSDRAGLRSHFGAKAGITT